MAIVRALPFCSLLARTEYRLFVTGDDLTDLGAFRAPLRP